MQQQQPSVVCTVCRAQRTVAQMGSLPMCAHPPVVCRECLGKDFSEQILDGRGSVCCPVALCGLPLSDKDLKGFVDAALFARHISRRGLTSSAPLIQQLSITPPPPPPQSPKLLQMHRTTPQPLAQPMPSVEEAFRMQMMTMPPPPPPPKQQQPQPTAAEPATAVPLEDQADSSTGMDTDAFIRSLPASFWE